MARTEVEIIRDGKIVSGDFSSGCVLTDSIGNLQVTTEKIADRSVTAQKLAASINFFPTGGIVMWSGSTSNIPSGWALCDGSSGTPDLRNRFIYGGSLTPGQTGGYETVKLNVSNLPAHNHKYVHSHYSGFAENPDSKVPDFGAYKSGKATYGRLGDIDTGELEGNEDRIFVSNPVDYKGSDNHFTDNTGGGTSHENMPPYHMLLYIMKL